MEFSHLLSKSDANTVNIVVVGDSGVGKTSLIQALISSKCTRPRQSVLDPVELPSELTNTSGVNVKVVDSNEHFDFATLHSAHAIVLVTAHTSNDFVARVSDRYLKLFSALNLQVSFLLFPSPFSLSSPSPSQSFVRSLLGSRHTRDQQKSVQGVSREWCVCAASVQATTPQHAGLRTRLLLLVFSIHFIIMSHRNTRIACCCSWMRLWSVLH